MPNIVLCISGDGEFVSSSIDDIPTLLQAEQAFAWIDVDVAQPDDLIALGSQLGLHRIAVDSALSEQERSKIMLFDDMLYVEFYGLRESDNIIAAEDMGMFVGERFLITARRHDRPSLAPLQQRWGDEIDRLRKHPPGSTSPHVLQPRHPAPTSVKLLYTLLDEMVDGYFPVMDAIGDRIEALEDQVIAGTIRNPQAEIQEMRSSLLRLRRLLSPEEAVLNTLLRRDIPIIEDVMVPYFADVQGHLLRIHDWLETYRDQISAIVDLQISLQSHRLNQTMRTLTASSIILMVCGLIAGVYGMNFDHMPELHWRLGYPFALALMVVSAIGLVVVFRRRGWWDS